MGFILWLTHTSLGTLIHFGFSTNLRTMKIVMRINVPGSVLHLNHDPTWGQGPSPSYSHPRVPDHTPRWGWRAEHCEPHLGISKQWESMRNSEFNYFGSIRCPSTLVSKEIVYIEFAKNSSHMNDHLVVYAKIAWTFQSSDLRIVASLEQEDIIPI